MFHLLSLQINVYSTCQAIPPKVKSFGTRRLNLETLNIIKKQTNLMFLTVAMLSP